MRLAPCPHILIDRLVHGGLHRRYRVTSHQGSNTQHCAGHTMVSVFPRQIFVLVAVCFSEEFAVLELRPRHYCRQHRETYLVAGLPFVSTPLPEERQYTRCSVGIHCRWVVAFAGGIETTRINQANRFHHTAEAETMMSTMLL